MEEGRRKGVKQKGRKRQAGGRTGTGKRRKTKNKKGAQNARAAQQQQHSMAKQAAAAKATRGAHLCNCAFCALPSRAAHNLSHASLATRHITSLASCLAEKGICLYLTISFFLHCFCAFAHTPACCGQALFALDAFAFWQKACLYLSQTFSPSLCCAAPSPSFSKTNMPSPTTMTSACTTHLP